MIIFDNEEMQKLILKTIGYFKMMTSFSIFRQNKKNQENFKLSLNNFENIMENDAFAPKEQMLHFP